MSTKMVKVLGILFIICFCVNKSSAQCSHTKPCSPLKGGLPFKQPTQIKNEHSNAGYLSFKLDVDMGEFTIDWLTVTRRLYNGELPGPTITLNNLQQPDFYDSAPNTFRMPNTTNIHTHGLHISSKEPQDNVLIKVRPEDFYKYVYEVDPTQPAGTYWYHPHVHGSTHFQSIGGMGGMIIIEDDFESMSTVLASVSCPQHCEHDVQIVLQTFQYSPDEESGYSMLQREIHDHEGFRLNNIHLDNSQQTLEEWLEDPVNAIKYTLVNGLLNPIYEMVPGQLKRFRILDTGGLYAVALHIFNLDPNGAPCTVKEIALDGIYLDKPRDPWLGRTFLPAAGRVDWLVVCPEAGNYELRSTFYDYDKMSLGEHPMATGTLMEIKVIGEFKPFLLPTILPTRPDYVSDLRDVAERDLKGHYAIEVTPTDTLNREDFNGNYPRYKVERGTIQEWYVTNTEMFTSHPIHMHINHAQIISYNKYTGPYGVDDGDGNWKLFTQQGHSCIFQHKLYSDNQTISSPSNALQYLGHDVRQNLAGPGTIGYYQIGDWRDTILVPPLSNITIRFKTDTYTGVVMVHCHLNGDADQGMMMTYDIVEPGENTTAFTTSGGAYPWSCMQNHEIGYDGSGTHASLSKQWLIVFPFLSLIASNLLSGNHL